MQSTALISYLLAASVAIATPPPVFAHAGHGDEFQADGGINRVKVNAETDSLLGLKVAPIAPAAGAAVMIPVTALVDANGKQLVFVQYENFYEPVPVTVGATKGDMVEVTKGLSVGEKLVTQGSLSLYAESRKTQTAASPAASASAPVASAASAPPATTHAQADAQGLPHNHDAAGNLVQSGQTAAPSGSALGLLAAVGGVVLLLVGGIVIAMSNRKKQETAADKSGEI